MQDVRSFLLKDADQGGQQPGLLQRLVVKGSTMVVPKAAEGDRVASLLCRGGQLLQVGLYTPDQEKNRLQEWREATTQKASY